MTFVSRPDDDLFEPSRARTARNYGGIAGIINAAASLPNPPFN